MNPEHLAAVNRRRRLLNHYDANLFSFRPSILSPKAFAEVVLDFTRWEEFNFDTVLWDIDGRMACYSSLFIPHYPSIAEWLDEGNDFLGHIVDGSKARGLETFLSFRANAGQDPNFDSVSFRDDHLEMLVNFNEDPTGLPQLHLDRFDGGPSQQKLDYANPAVRDFHIGALRELATNYDIDGLQLDFARGAPFLHVGHQWELRDELTQFMRDMRTMMTTRAIERGRPLLLAVRIAETVEGCHFDGIDIETWIEDELIDLAILGCRSFDVDLAAFKSLTVSTPVKLYPTHDNHHSSDGYKCTPLRVLRGIAANWWNQGADGIGVFNFTCSDGVAVENAGLRDKPISPCHLQNWDENRTFLSEAGGPTGLIGKSKTYAMQRRSGGAPWEFGYPEEGITVNHAYQNANPLAQLPSCLGLHGVGATYLKLYIGEASEDLERYAAQLRLLISDPSGANAADLIESGLIRRNPYVLGDGVWTQPLSSDTASELEVRFNNSRLKLDGVIDGWLVYRVELRLLASGVNLLTLRLERDSDKISVEKVELDLDHVGG